MANDQGPMIRVIGFHTTYELHPKRGDDPLNDNVDAKGFLLNEKGQRIMENAAVDWVKYAPAHNIAGTQNVERVKALMPTEKHVGETGAMMMARWAQIEPSYRAWKDGQELPLGGMPLAAWSGVNPGQIEVLRNVGVRTVEELAALNDGQLERVRLPMMRELRQQASLFLQNLDAATSAQREAEKDREIAAMKERLEELSKMIGSETEAEPTGDDVAALRAELEAKGIDYDKRWAAPKLRAALAEAA